MRGGRKGKQARGVKGRPARRGSSLLYDDHKGKFMAWCQDFEARFSSEPIGTCQEGNNLLDQLRRQKDDDILGLLTGIAQTVGKAVGSDVDPSLAREILSLLIGILLFLSEAYEDFDTSPFAEIFQAVLQTGSREVRCICFELIGNNAQVTESRAFRHFLKIALDAAVSCDREGNELGGTKIWEFQGVKLCLTSEPVKAGNPAL